MPIDIVENLNGMEQKGCPIKRCFPALSPAWMRDATHGTSMLAPEGGRAKYLGSGASGGKYSRMITPWTPG